MMTHDIEKIAQICHTANKAYCESIGDYSQLDWQEAPQWQKQSAINGVKYHLDNPNSTPEDSHNNWLEHKGGTGWSYGPVKDELKKEHPCYLPYENLPIEQRRKDYLFVAIVRALSSE